MLKPIYLATPISNKFDQWQHVQKEPYLVTLVLKNDIPVFKVLQEDGTGSERTLHRNLLLPFNVIPTNTDLTNVI